MVDSGPSVAPRSFVVPSEMVPERSGIVSFVGSNTREGEWLLPRLLRVVSIFGNVEIDLTRARVGPGTSRIEVLCVFGNVEITVPPEMRVESDGSGMLSNFETNTKVQPVLAPDAPLISVGGTAYFGNVEIRVVDPNAPGWFDKLTARLRK